MESSPASRYPIALALCFAALVACFRLRDHEVAAHGTALLGGFAGNVTEADEAAVDRMGSFLEFDRGKLGIQAELPDPMSVESRIPVITVRKSDGATLPVPGKRTEWNYLTRSLRQAIREGEAQRGRPQWRRLVVHESGSASGNAEWLDVYHQRQRPDLVGGAYHFVIGNGSYSSDGEITLGQHWTEQQPSAAMDRDEVNADSLSVCLIGDFAETGPSAHQWRALDELTAYLRARLGPISLVTHRQLESSADTCPGPGFSREMLEQLSALTLR